MSQSQNFNNYFPNDDQVVAGGDLSTWSITGGNGFGWSGTEIQASEFQATRIHNSNFYNKRSLYFEYIFN